MATSSLASLVVGASSAAQAACYTGPFGFTNGGALSCVTVANTSFTGNITNTGTISPGGINLTNSTITGRIVDTGTITGGIAIDVSSKINQTSPSPVIGVQNTLTFGGGISNGGTLSAVETGIRVATVSTFSGGVFSSGAISSGSSPAIGLSNILSFAGGISVTGGTVTARSSTAISVSGVTNFSGGIFNGGTISGSACCGNGHGISIQQVSTFSGGIANIGTIRGSCGDGIRINQVTKFTGGISNGGTIRATTGNGITLGISTFQGGITNTGLISGDTGIYLHGGGVGSTSNVSIFDSGTITGTSGTAIEFGGGVNTLTLGTGFVINGIVDGTATNNNVLQFAGSGNGVFNLSQINSAQQYRGFETFSVLSGNWTFIGTFSQSNPWTVQGGTLLVDGNLSSASSITVNAGATLGGFGTLPNTLIVSGGTLAPGGPPIPAARPLNFTSIGNVLTVRGNLVMQPGANYAVQVTPTTASRTNVTGTANIAGTVLATPTGGTYTLGTTYTIMTATGGVNGTFPSLITTGSFGRYRPVVSYDANDVFLTMQYSLFTPFLPPTATVNERDVAGALDAFVLGGGTLPPDFYNILNFTPQQIQNALNQLTGEVGTGAQQTGFQLMTQFMDLLFDALGGPGGGSATMSFAPARQEFPDDVALAYASVLKAPSKAKSVISTWAAGYGGTNRTDGDPVVIGSSDLSTRTFGMAAGLDYQVAPGTKLGFAVGGAGANWSLSGGLGSGNSNAIQLGAYGTRQFGAAYVSGAVAGAVFQMTTNRSLTGPALPSDTLTANFSAQGLGGRLEAGYRIPVSMAPVGITPYAAVQAQSFWTASYMESGQLPGLDPFALAFGERRSNAVRTELGSRFDRIVPLTQGSLGLFGRLAWAHDTQSNVALTPAFFNLATPTFVINGAAIPHDKALATAGGEWHLANGWSLVGKFDGELANHSSTYTGTGKIKYTW